MVVLLKAWFWLLFSFGWFCAGPQSSPDLFRNLGYLLKLEYWHPLDNPKWFDRVRADESKDVIGSNPTSDNRLDSHY
jgi:hypothetical protein